MNHLFIVPDVLRHAIDAALDKAFAECPEAPAGERRQHYEFLLCFFNEHGYVPEFSLVKNVKPIDTTPPS